MRDIREIIIHCSATREGQPFTVADIDRWHRQRGFNQIGYHYIIYLDGSIHACRPVEIEGAHCVGHNRQSIGVCYIGGLDRIGQPADTRTAAQKKGLLALLTKLKTQYPHAQIYSHRDFARKACPCFDATAEYARL